jgi:C_GCAxxG_C_C family probable redox protein
MIVKNGLRFNCCESVLLIVDEKHPLPGLNSAVMKTASNLGGGVAGVGSICGAITGGAMAIGLIMGTEGIEPPQKFDEMRVKERKITLELIDAFNKKWGNINCSDLLGCPGCTPEQRAKRGDELRARGESHCDEYVEWAAAETLKILKKTQ